MLLLVGRVVSDCGCWLSSGEEDLCCGMKRIILAASRSMLMLVETKTLEFSSSALSFAANMTFNLGRRVGMLLTGRMELLVALTISSCDCHSCLTWCLATLRVMMGMPCCC